MPEIFRHLRPVYYDKRKHEIIPEVKGGISFLLSSTEKSHYQYWLYMCPLDTSFSSKHSINRLRNARNSGVSNWGEIILDGRKLLDLLIEDCKTREHYLPSCASTMVGLISNTISNANLLFESRLNHIKDAYKYYK